MDEILRYFPDLSDQQKTQFQALEKLYTHWNEQINVISRKDLDSLYERHVLHSLGIAKVFQFQDQSEILDVGCGGGFPGIPLAILYPNCHFTLVDSIGKKIKVVAEVSEALGLSNVSPIHGRAEKVKSRFDFVVSRAVTQMSAFVPWVRNSFKQENKHPKPNGILYLKGGDLKEELKPFENKGLEVFNLNEYFEADFFETKKVVYLPINKK